MKTSFYHDGKDFQIVLTPENDFETDIIKNIKPENLEIKLFKGEFYENMTGYYRFKSNNDNNLILRLNEKYDF